MQNWLKSKAQRHTQKHKNELTDMGEQLRATTCSFFNGAHSPLFWTGQRVIHTFINKIFGNSPDPYRRNIGRRIVRSPQHAPAECMKEKQKKRVEKSGQSPRNMADATCQQLSSRHKEEQSYRFDNSAFEFNAVILVALSWTNTTTYRIYL